MMCTQCLFQMIEYYLVEHIAMNKCLTMWLNLEQNSPNFGKYNSQEPNFNLGFFCQSEIFLSLFLSCTYFLLRLCILCTLIPYGLFGMDVIERKCHSMRLYGANSNEAGNWSTLCVSIHLYCANAELYQIIGHACYMPINVDIFHFYIHLLPNSTHCLISTSKQTVWLTKNDFR